MKTRALPWVTADAGKDMTMFRNHYHCPACGCDWQDEWECACNDECPQCSLGDIEPHESEEIEAALP